MALKLTVDANTVADNSRPAVLYSATQHAREWISTEVSQRLLEWLIKMYREDRQEIVDLLGSTELWFVRWWPIPTATSTRSTTTGCGGRTSATTTATT